MKIVDDPNRTNEWPAHKLIRLGFYKDDAHIKNAYQLHTQLKFKVRTTYRIKAISYEYAWLLTAQAKYPINLSESYKPRKLRR
jgi:hypothetical protein